MFAVISDSKIQAGHSNGARTRVLVFSNAKGEKFQISIKSESYEFQSYAILSKWSDSNGWNTIVRKNPKKDFGVDISYADSFSQSAFDGMVSNLQKIAETF